MRLRVPTQQAAPGAPPSRRNRARLLAISLGPAQRKAILALIVVVTGATVLSHWFSRRPLPEQQPTDRGVLFPTPGSDRNGSGHILTWRPQAHLHPEHRSYASVLLRSPALPVAYLVSAFLDLRPLMLGKPAQVVALVAANLEAAPRKLVCRMLIPSLGRKHETPIQPIHVPVTFNFVWQFRGRW